MCTIKCKNHLYVDMDEVNIDNLIITFLICSEGVGREPGETNDGEPSDKSQQQLVLKCDLQERILDPALFGANLQQQMVRSTIILY